jgi:DNA-binding beta-propeller fold protein YncE
LNVFDPEFRLVDATALDDRQIRLEYSGAVDAAMARVVTNFTLTPTVAIQSATRLAAEPHVVVLRSAQLDPESTYSIISHVRSEFGAPATRDYARFRSATAVPEALGAVGGTGCSGTAFMGPAQIGLVGAKFAVSELTGHQIQLVSWDGTLLGFLGHDGNSAGLHHVETALGCPGEEGSALAGAFDSPRGVAMLEADQETLVVADTGNNRLERWDKYNRYLEAIPWDGTSPVGLGVANDRRFMADASDRVFAIDGQTASYAFGVPGSGLHGLALGVASGETPAMASRPGGGFLLTYPGNHRVKAYTAQTEPEGYLGAGNGWSTGGDCCAASTSLGRFTSPTGVAVDRAGFVYVVDRAGGGRIQKFNQDGVAVWQVALDFVPGGMVLDGYGVLWIADTHGNQVLRFQR